MHHRPPMGRPGGEALLIAGLALLFFAISSAVLRGRGGPALSPASVEGDIDALDHRGGWLASEVPAAPRNFLAERGMPLVDGYPGPSKWDLASELPGWQSSSYAIGLGNLTDSLCRGERNSTKMIFSPWGLGSNLLVIADAIIYASLIRPDEPFVLVDTQYRPRSEEADPSRKNKAWASRMPLEESFIRQFSFADAHDSVCPNYKTTCGDCIDTGPCAACVRTEEHVIAQLAKLESKRPSLYYALEVDTVRLITRLKPDTYKAVARELGGLKKLWNQTVAIHVRRGDKLKREATKTPTPTYLSFMKEIERQQGWAFARIVVLSDDPGVKFEMHSVLPHHTGLVVRVSTARVDHPESLEEAHMAANLAMVTTIADLHAMASAHWFIGTTSSSFGRTACILRGGFQCVNAENSKGIWGPFPGQKHLWRGMLG